MGTKGETLKRSAASDMPFDDDDATVDHRELIARIRKIEIATTRKVNDQLAGQYHSVFKGRGMSFDEVRPYQPGDEIRFIDWNVTARSNEPFVKRFVEERELTVMLLVDASASLRFGSNLQLKREVAAELAALLAFSATKNNDRVGLAMFLLVFACYRPNVYMKRANFSFLPLNDHVWDTMRQRTGPFRLDT